jgi:hypothetical protein
MTEAAARDDIAFIRRAIEDGRAYASARGADMVVWGVAVAIGHLGTYALARGWLSLSSNWLWIACLGLSVLFSLRRILPAVFGSRESRPRTPPMTRAMRMLWLGCGIFLLTFAAAAAWTGDNREGWADVFSTSILGVGFFASASLCNLPWMRWVAGGWWLGFIATYALHGRVELMPLSAGLILLLLALPGVVLLRSRPRAGGR